MAPIKQFKETMDSLENQLYRYERIIESLTDRIALHRNRKSDMQDDSRLVTFYRKRFYEWRRVSIALHRKRSELKNRKEMVGKTIEQLMEAKNLFQN